MICIPTTSKQRVKRKGRLVDHAINPVTGHSLCGLSARRNALGQWVRRRGQPITCPVCMSKIIPAPEGVVDVVLRGERLIFYGEGREIVEIQTRSRVKRRTVVKLDSGAWAFVLRPRKEAQRAT
jgi:hypothetical protein